MDHNKSEIDLWRSKAKALEQSLVSTEYISNEMKAQISKRQYMNEMWHSKAKTLEQSLESTEYTFNELKVTINGGQFTNAANIDKINEVEKQSIALSD